MTDPKRRLVRGGQVYDHDGDVHNPPVADILIDDGKIVAVGADLATDGAHELIDATGRLVVPGLINAHYHSHDTLCRGLFEELPLEMWLLYTLPMGAEPQQGGGARAHLGRRARVIALRHHHRARHAGPHTAQRGRYRRRPRRLSRSRHPRRVLAHGLPTCRRSQWCATRTACPPTSRRCWAPQALPMREQLDYLEHQFKPASRRRHAALGGRAVCAAALHARRCWKAAPSSPTSTTSPSTPMSTRPEARR